MSPERVFGWLLGVVVLIVLVLLVFEILDRI